MSDMEAYQFVAETARHVTSYLEVRGFRDLGWLREVEQVALSRALSVGWARRSGSD